MTGRLEITMNQKRAKFLRRTIKTVLSRDARESVIALKTGMWSGPQVLTKDCGRAQYQDLKRKYKAARQSGAAI
jgi:hypothetical protein